MSEKKASGEDIEGSVDDKKNSVSYDSFQKVLGEKKTMQKTVDEMKLKLAEYEEKALSQETDLKKQNELLQKKLKETNDKALSSVKMFNEKVVKSKFQAEAAKLGCLNADLAYKAIDLTNIEIGENFELDSDSIKTAIEGFAKANPYLFKNDVPAPRNGKPANDSSGGIDFKKMSSTEIKEHLLSK